MTLKNQTIAIALCALTATAALAHSGVKNKAVKAWMQGMGAIGKNTKVLGEMHKGKVEFDATEARQAARAIARQAGKIPALFENPASDPKSEALQVIWEDFDDFAAKASDLQQAATQAADRIRTKADLRTALGQIGGSCKACHGKYRE